MNTLRLGWVAASVLFLFAPLRGDDFTSAPLSRETDIDYKLKSIMVSVDFDNATIEQATAALTLMSRQADSSPKGIVFDVTPEASSEAKRITLKLDKVPLGETIRYVCLLGNVGYKVDDTFVVIRPAQWTGMELQQRTFHVDPNFVETAQRAGVIPAPQVAR